MIQMSIGPAGFISQHFSLKIATDPRSPRVVGLGAAGIIYGGCRLAGSFVYFWLMLMCTLSNGIGRDG